jgi:hypothetical protein
MSVTLPIGPLQITTTISPTETTNGAITITAGATASTCNVSITANNVTQQIAAQDNGGGRFTGSLTENSVTTTISGGFTNNLQGNGTVIVQSQGTGGNRMNWTAQLGEANVPFKISSHAEGTLTIAGNQVTFAKTGGASVTVTIDPATGIIAPTTISFVVGGHTYTQVSGTFTSNVAGSGGFRPVRPGRHRQNQNDSWEEWATD